MTTMILILLIVALLLLDVITHWQRMDDLDDTRNPT
jgi:hypothetical protein